MHGSTLTLHNQVLEVSFFKQPNIKKNYSWFLEEFRIGLIYEIKDQILRLEWKSSVLQFVDQLEHNDKLRAHKNEDMKTWMYFIMENSENTKGMMKEMKSKVC